LYALRLQWSDQPVLPPGASSATTHAEYARPAIGPTVAGPVITELMKVMWRSPYPAFLQDARQRIVDVNPAFTDFCGREPKDVVGRDPITLEPAEDRASSQALRERWLDPKRRAAEPALTSRRLVGADGRERWCRVAITELVDEGGRAYALSVLQDITAEHAARERADRSARELDDWFDLSPIGMALFDEAGLVVRTNPAFDALAGAVPALLSEAAPELQQLLGWGDATVAARLRPGAPPVVIEGWLPSAAAGQRRLRSTVRCYAASGGQRRQMAILEDRSIEEERDLAQMQVGALMDTAGVGLATFQESSGWVRQSQPASDSGDTAVARVSGAPTSAALQSISRDLVAEESLAAYDTLQQALRTAQRAEVRYAIRHPDLGLRWLITRVEPATLASGKRTTSVVTLDITEQHQTQQRSERLLHELSTILESSTAGIASLRGTVLVRCNPRFEAMLGLPASSGAGRSFETLLAAAVPDDDIAARAQRTLAAGLVFETEFAMSPPEPHDQAAVRWYSLSVRRTVPIADAGQGETPSAESGDGIEAIAVLSDITRLKSQQAELEQLARDRELMFSLSEVGIAFVRDGVLHRANEALALLAGVPTQALLGLPLAALFADPLDSDQLRAPDLDALGARGRWTGERQLRQRDGRVLWVQVSTRRVSDDQSDGGVIASFVNVDDRHRAEQALALQAHRTRAILDSVLVGIVTVGRRGIEWMNRSARRMFGADLGDFIDQPISTVATPEPDHPFRRTQYLDDLLEGEAETFECRVQARDGREFWVVGNAVVTGRESRGRQLTYALLDIQQRREAEARIEEAQASLQRIIEAAPMAITVRDARSLRVLQANQAAAASVSLTTQAIVGRSPEELFDAADAAQRRRDMEEALASSDVTQREYRLTHEGRLRVWDARYMPLAAPGTAPDQLLMVATDVTEQRAAEQARFDAAIAQREMLVKEVHHRIKNNLQGVAGLLQQIAARKPDMAEAMAEVIGQVQAIAQVYGLQVGAGGPLQVAGVVGAIAASVQRTFGQPIAFAVEGDATDRWALPEAESIPIALTLNELLTNAIKHSARQTPGMATTGASPALTVTPVDCLLRCSETGVQVVIRNLGRLPADFDLARVRGGVSGLGLVRALLPRRCAVLDIVQDGTEVVTTVSIGPPAVTPAAETVRAAGLIG
jgi:PAS domain S-box-containing protein